MPPPTRSSRGAPPAGSLDPSAALTQLSAVVLVRGSESLLADRAVARVLELARAADPGVDVSRIEAAGYAPGELELVAAPSLFGEQRCVVVSGVESATEAFLDDALAYVRSPPPDVTLVLRHSGGQRGKKLLDAVSGSFPVVACEPVKRDGDKMAFARQELERVGRRADGRALQALVAAVGTDLQELASACSQLAADTTGRITEDVVQRYHGGRVEATGFAVADAAIAGDGAEALRLLRHGFATGLDPLPLVAALALKLRTIAKVAAVRGQGAGAERELGLAPWQLDRARRELTGWTPEGLASAIEAVAAADAEVKGAARDPAYAVERAVLRVARSHR